MKFIRVTRDLWINFDVVETILRNEDGTASIQTPRQVYTSELPLEAIISGTQEQHEEPTHVQVRSPLTDEYKTDPAW